MRGFPQQGSPARARPAIAAATKAISLANRLLLAALTAAALLVAAHQPAHAQPAVPALILPATASENARYSSTLRRAEPGVSRQKPVRLESQNLDDRQAAPVAQLRLDLFDAESVTLIKSHVERRGPSNYTWHGKPHAHPDGFALITVVDGQVSGMIDLGDARQGARGRYRLQSTNDGLTLLQEIDTATFPDDHPGAVAPVAPSGGTKSRMLSQPNSKSISPDELIEKADSAATIDVLVVYSNQTAVAAGAGIGAQIQQAIDTANLVYANSGITTRLRLVHAGPAGYDESGDFVTELNRVTSSTDGHMDNVAILRDLHGADLVSLFIENGQYCGYGWIGPSANYAFSVVNRGCASGNLSFPHELGHNFGARHDTYVDATNTPYAYGHGWVDVGQRWRDVMAYNNACAAAGVSCTRIPYLSNPHVTYGSPPNPLGSTSTADTTRVHNQNALTMANFRPAAGGGTTNCTWSLSATGANVPSAAGAGSVGISTQTGCAWNAASNASWLSIAASSSGSGTLAYSYGANSGPARNATLTVGGNPFVVGQASGCTYALSSSSASVPATGASGSTTLSTTSGCAWTAVSSAAWLTVSGAFSGTGSATVGYVAAVNTGAARSANLTLGGRTFLVSQAAATSAAPAATLSPASLDLGGVMVGKTSAVRTATVSNSGGGTLTVVSLSMGGVNPAEFTRLGTCSVNTALAPGQSCTLSITFSPSTTGVRSASISVDTTSGELTLALRGTGKKTGRK